MNTFWSNLTDRERVVILGGLVAIGVMALFLLVYSPISSWREAAGERALAGERNLNLVREAAALRPQQDAIADVDSETPMRSAIPASSTEFGVSLNFVNPLPDGRFAANAGNVAPEALFNWLGALERDYGVRVVSADIAREPNEPEALRAQLVFAR